MPLHFARFSARARSSGVILLREAIAISSAIEEIVLIRNASEAEEWADRLVWVPLIRTSYACDHPRSTLGERRLFSSQLRVLLMLLAMKPPSISRAL